MPKALLLIFVKHPIPGQVKTRLAATLGNEKALAIYQDLLTYTLKLSQKLDVDKAVFYGNEVPMEDLWQAVGYRRFIQQGEDLGSRMQQAFAWGFEQGYERIVIVGSDCAQLTASHVQTAFELLANHDAVIGPAEDGGYYALGLSKMQASLFQGKVWSTSEVFRDCVRELVNAQQSFALLPTLSDIDFEEDLQGTFLEKYL